jgi:UDP-glucose-4-epimerase GalE
MNILVTGGAGYVGSHAARLLDRAGHYVWIYDNLSQGHRQAAIPGRLIEADLADGEELRRALRKLRIDAVMHFAAHSLVGESVVAPAKYYGNNVVGAFSLLEAMRDVGVRQIVFSSTTAVYGAAERCPITEDAPLQPINPYGFTKLVIERALADYARAYGFGFAALRYFNAAGASADGDLGEDHRPETHLIPLVLEVALGRREAITIFGDGYPTPDGTCIRDYIHVDDLADAHMRALERLKPGEGMHLNLGTGRGHSVREIIESCRRVTGAKIPEIIGERRPGDPPSLIADSARAQSFLGWRPRYIDLDCLIETAWRWRRTHPDGYKMSAAFPAVATDGVIAVGWPSPTL